MKIPNYNYLIVTIILICNGVQLTASSLNEIYSRKADSLIQLMTLDEKIGQLNLLYAKEGSVDSAFFAGVKEGNVGGVFFAYGVDFVTKIQKYAVEESRMKIPVIFGLDVVNGHRTVFPIGLAQACTWDMDLIERIERVAATEASAEGVNWFFAPMVDITRDPRWGRACESPGEDTWLASRIAEAKIKGFQGNDLSLQNTVMACPKHFFAYGAPLAGKDYNTVDMSERTLYEWYLPPYKACIDAGVGSIMSSFNDLNGIPAVGHKKMLNDLLRNEWNFDGLVTSDYEAVFELVNYGLASDYEQSAKMALEAGNDFDMVSKTFISHLGNLVEKGQVNEVTIDAAVKNVLIAKYKLGLFDDPYKYCSKEREKEDLLRSEHLDLAREAAAKACVLLKNENKTLPLKKDLGSIAVVGPLAEARKELFGSNLIAGDPNMGVSVLDGIKDKISKKTTLHYEKGCNIDDDDISNINKAVAAANQSDFVVLVLGESEYMSGESDSRSNIILPGVQNELARQVIETGKPCVVVVAGARPLILTELDRIASSILMAWQGGIQAGNGIADVLFGDYNPSGKLAMTFPRNMGQIPIYYNHTRIGRPSPNPQVSGKFQDWRAVHIDSPSAPLYPFGFGLSYTNFEYSDLQSQQEVYGKGSEIKVSVKITNTGNVAGDEIAQLYLRDVLSEITRPVKELRGSKKIYLEKGQSQVVEFTLSEADLAYYHSDMTFKYDPGEFEIQVGTSSDKTIAINIQVK